MDNSAWLSWINKSTTKNRYYEAYYKNNTSRYAAIGLGLLQDSDVWPNPSTPDIKEAANATRLINFAEDKGKSWQDPETQMTWIFEELDRLPSSVNGLSRINSASNNAILESGREAPYVQEIAVQRPDFC